MDFTLPACTLRDYQIPMFEAYDAGCDRFMLTQHRRAGKDLGSFNFAVTRAWERVGTYYHISPFLNQAKKIIWENRTIDGRAMLDFIPEPLIANKRESDLTIVLKNGSIIQLLGSEYADRIVGSNPVGVILSEAALHQERVWSQILSPILMVNKGWIIFNGTPRGRNWYYDLWMATQGNQRWYHSLLTVDDTKDEAGNPIVTQEDIAEWIAMGNDPELKAQEWYCSFTGVQSGTVYGPYIEAALAEGRII